MRIRAAEVTELRWPLAVPLRTSRGALRERRGFVLALIAESGAVGLGEASPATWVGAEELDAARASLGEIAALCRAGTTREGRDLAVALAGRLTPAAAAALDGALLDLAARERGISVADLLAESDEPAHGAAATVAISALLVETSSPAVAREAAARAAQGFSTCKLKVGRPNPEVDLRRIAAVSRALPATARLRLDANRAWSAAQADAFFARIDASRVEFVEEPLADPTAAALAELRGRRGIRVALDESVDSVARLEELAAARALDVVILKAARLGGLRPALHLARVARDLDLDVVVTDSLEGPIGMTAAVELAAALPAPRRAVGLGGARLLESAAVPAWLRAASIAMPCPRAERPLFAGTHDAVPDA